MNEHNKNRVNKGLEVLLLVILLSIGVGAAFGCFNYATYAKELGKPDGFFWFVGIAEIAITVFYFIRRFKQLMAE